MKRSHTLTAIITTCIVTSVAMPFVAGCKSRRNQPPMGYPQASQAVESYAPMQPQYEAAPQYAAPTNGSATRSMPAPASASGSGTRAPAMQGSGSR